MDIIEGRKTSQILSNSSRKHLVFLIDKNSFGIPLSSIREVIGESNISTVPNSPNFFTGLINLRGRIISVIDLRVKLNIKAAKESQRKTIIIIEHNSLTLGLLIDEVRDVENIPFDKIEKDLNLPGQLNKDHFEGVSKGTNGDLTLIIDLNNVLDLSTLKRLKLV